MQLLQKVFSKVLSARVPNNKMEVCVQRSGPKKSFCGMGAMSRHQLDLSRVRRSHPRILADQEHASGLDWPLDLR